MKTVHEVSKLAGVSVRALHHYDEIGLLKPAKTSDAGYRLYDEKDLARLQSILFFRELDFPLADIKNILDAPDFDIGAAMREQLKMLELKKERTERLISLIRDMTQKGTYGMDFNAFDNSELENYAKEAKERWGGTSAYKESEKREKNRSEKEKNALADGMMSIFARFGEIKNGDPESPEAKALVGELQDFITEHYYPCTDEILRGLGEMYVGDERFRKNIDASGGDGTAAFVRKAIHNF